MIAVVVRVTLRRYVRSLGLANTFAHLKVIVSFVTVAATLDSQFG